MLIASMIGPAGAERIGAAFAEGGFVLLYHGTTRSAASRIAAGGFRPGKDGAVFFAESQRVADVFASMAVEARGARSGSVLILRVPTSMLQNMSRGPIGYYRGARWGAELGFERILSGDGVSAFNAAMGDGTIGFDIVRSAPGAF
jgi:hypothetical protein